jgi:hypothetical protein
VFYNYQLTYKAKGLLNQMLSLREDWEYSLQGLSRLALDGIASVRAGIRELETAGYVVREQIRTNGKMDGYKYYIYEVPMNAGSASPSCDFPTTEILTTTIPMTRNQTQLSTNKLKTNKLNTDIKKINSFPITSISEANPSSELNGSETENDFSKIIKGNIEYEWLIEEHENNKDMIFELTSLIIEVMESKAPSYIINGTEYKEKFFKERFLQLRSNHILFILDSLNENHTEVRNMKKYLIATLFNAPTTIDNYYNAMVNHDWHTGKI